LSIFNETQKVSTTQVGNFVETRPLTVAINQADGKQRNKIFAILFRIAHNGNRIKQRERSVLEGKDNPQL
jgi:hypothetical protein